MQRLIQITGLKIATTSALARNVVCPGTKITRWATVTICAKEIDHRLPHRLLPYSSADLAVFLSRSTDQQSSMEQACGFPIDQNGRVVQMRKDPNQLLIRADTFTQVYDLVGTNLAYWALICRTRDWATEPDRKWYCSGVDNRDLSHGISLVDYLDVPFGSLRVTIEAPKLIEDLDPELVLPWALCQSGAADANLPKAVRKE